MLCINVIQMFSVYWQLRVHQVHILPSRVKDNVKYVQHALLVQFIHHMETLLTLKTHPVSILSYSMISINI